MTKRYFLYLGRSANTSQPSYMILTLGLLLARRCQHQGNFGCNGFRFKCELFLLCYRAIKPSGENYMAIRKSKEVDSFRMYPVQLQALTQQPIESSKHLTILLRS